MFSTIINGIPLTFETTAALFSPNAADRGTLAMLAEADVYLSSRIEPLKILDLCCGYGLVGVYLAKKYEKAALHLSDNDPGAVACARANVQRNGAANTTVTLSDGFSSLTETGYTMILCNPPYHSDFSVAKKLIEKGFNRLALGGVMMLVTKRREWYKQKMIAVFGGVTVAERDGYFVFMAEKRHWRYGKGRAGGSLPPSQLFFQSRQC